MKRVLKWLAIGIAGLVVATVLFVLSGYLLPAEVVLDLEQSVDASPEAVFAVITTLDGVERWWRQAASEMGGDFEVSHLAGPQRGAGMELGFGAPEGPVMERWSYRSAVPPGRVEIDVDFQIFTSHRVLELTPTKTGAIVRWKETALVESPIWRWMLKLGRADAIENRHTVMRAAGTAAAH